MREFADGEIAPGAAERDELARFPSELIPKLAEQGLLGIMVPEEYGGAGYDAISSAIILEEIARVDAAVALLVGSHNSLCSGHILLAGNDDQKRTFLPPLARGEKLGAWALTEPGSGSDAGSMRTRATLEGDHWLIRGDKQFITQGSTAGTYVIMASTDPSQGTRGISAFIVDRETPGLVVGKLEKKLGVRASDTAALHFDDMRVPKDRLLGKQNEGFKDVLSVLAAARIGMAALAVGIAQGALDEALNYAKKKASVRQADPRVRSDPVDARRHGHRKRGCAADGVARRDAARRGRAVSAHRVAGQAVLVRSRSTIDIESDPDSRRIRIPEGLAGRALLSRREAVRDRRRHV